MFKVFGFIEERVNEKFGYLLEVFKYGIFFYVGLVFGFDRFVMLFVGIDNIREVIVFFKN